MNDVLFYVLGLGAPIAAAAFSLTLIRKIRAADPGTDRMQKIASQIRAGAMAFLKTEYSRLAFFVGAMIVLLAFALPTRGMATAAAFLVGAAFSGAAGWVGMRTAEGVSRSWAGQPSFVRAMTPTSTTNRSFSMNLPIS